MDQRSQLSRRTILQGGAVLGAAAAATATLGACSAADPAKPTTPAPSADREEPMTPSESTEPESSGSRTLLAYFSRAGENYYRGGRRNLEVGNTEVLARMIAELIDCDVYRIEAADPYSTSYDATVSRNSREQNEDARPEILEPLASIEQYDTVLLGSPIWNVGPPMIMATFTDDHDFAGTTVHPFVTYAVSGLGRAESDYTTWCRGARIAPGLAIQGEEAAEHRTDVEAWLRDAGLLD